MYHIRPGLFAHKTFHLQLPCVSRLLPGTNKPDAPIPRRVPSVPAAAGSLRQTAVRARGGRVVLHHLVEAQAHYRTERRVYGRGGDDPDHGGGGGVHGGLPRGERRSGEREGQTDRQRGKGRATGRAICRPMYPKCDGHAEVVRDGQGGAG